MKNKMNISLRPANLGDVNPLVDLSHKTVLVKYPDIIGKETVEGYVASDAVPKFYTDRIEFCRVAMVMDKPVGVYALRDNAIDLMMVTLDHHRSGIGSFLIISAENQLFLDHDKISLESFRDNAQAVNFYKKHSWEIEDEYDDPEHGIPMVRMIKLISPDHLVP